MAMPVSVVPFRTASKLLLNSSRKGQCHTLSRVNQLVMFTPDISITPIRKYTQHLMCRQSLCLNRNFQCIPRRQFRNRAERNNKANLSKTSKTSHHQEYSLQRLVRPLGFTVMMCGCGFTASMVMQYEKIRAHARQLRGQYGVMGYKHGSLRQHANALWNRLSAGEKVVSVIIALNTAVLLAWRVPSLGLIMTKYFSSTPISGASSLSMLLSVFSHHSVFHYAANMYVLWSFATPIGNILGQEQLIGFYVSAGVISSLASYIFKIMRCSPMTSLGASGAIIAVLGATCISQPDSQLEVAFIGSIFPHSFSAATAVKSLILLDTAGIYLGWKLFDHAAHLGGMLFGLWYVKYGDNLVWGNREYVMKLWHKIRGDI